MFVELLLTVVSGDSSLLAKKVKILPHQRHLALIYFDVGRLSGDCPGGKEERSPGLTNEPDA